MLVGLVVQGWLLLTRHERRRRLLEMVFVAPLPGNVDVDVAVVVFFLLPGFDLAFRDVKNDAFI